MIIIILPGSGKCLEGLGETYFPLKFLETAQCNLYLINSSKHHCRSVLSQHPTEDVGEGPDLPQGEASPWGLGLNSKIHRTK